MAFNEDLCLQVCRYSVMVIALLYSTAELVLGSIFRNKCTIQEHIPTYQIVSGVFGILAILIIMTSRYRAKEDPYSENHDLEIDRAFYGYQQQADEMDKQIVNRKKSDDISIEDVNLSAIRNVVLTFKVAWLITGSYWIYTTFGDYISDDEGSPAYCHRELYLAAFWLLTTVYIVLGLIVLGFIILSVIYVILEIRDS